MRSSFCNNYEFVSLFNFVFTDFELYLKSVIILIVQIQLPQFLPPVARPRKVLQRLAQISLRVAELDLPIRRPGNFRPQQRHRAALVRRQLERVTEQRVGDRSTGGDRMQLVLVGVRKRGAIAGGGAREAPQQLVIVAALDVPAVVLVVVRKAVVHVNLAHKVLLEGEVYDAGALFGLLGAEDLGAGQILGAHLEAFGVVVDEFRDLGWQEGRM